MEHNVRISYRCEDNKTCSVMFAATDIPKELGDNIFASLKRYSEKVAALEKDGSDEKSPETYEEPYDNRSQVTGEDPDDRVECVNHTESFR